MTTRPNHAHVVLQDAKYAIRNYDCSLQAEAFRISWLTIISLLRAVGHVLKNVDAKASPALERSIKEKWDGLQASKPQPIIFWGFIDEERNRFLKEYAHGISRTSTIETLIPGVFATLDLANARGGTFSPLPLPQSHLRSGPFADRNEKEVAWEAYAWWREYLKDVESIACTYLNNSQATPSPLPTPPTGG